MTMNGLERLRTALSGRYMIEREVGAGGMATVYLAQDVRHDRQVAIKVLHEDLGATLGPERFLAEIKTTAKLQHPHILPLLDSGEADGLLYYVMPYVDGETLRDRLTRETQLPIEDAVGIAREVADALAFAHGHGTVHRDIKPENILLQGGHALVADFGIALAVQHAAGTRLTQTGLSLGTPQYMSPEQAMGDRTVDHRSDIYALGAMTYEMLTGDPPFTGSSVQAIVAKVLSSEPERLTTTRRTITPNVEVAVLRALAKLPADRFASAAQFAQALSTPLGHDERLLATASRAPASTAALTSRWWPMLTAGAVLAAVLASVVAVRATREARLATSVSQYDVVLPDSAPIAIDGGTAVDVSPRGDFAVYIARRGNGNELWYRSLVDTLARPLPGTTGAFFLALSPGGDAVAFVAENRVRLASLTGGPVRELGTVRRPEGITWRTNDHVVVGDADLGLTEFDRLGGASRQLARGACAAPAFVGSEHHVLCNARLLDLDSDSTTRLTVGDSRGRSGAEASIAGLSTEAIDGEHLLYSAPDGSVIGARWSPETGVVRQRVVVHTGMRVEGVYGYRQAAISASGALVYVPGTFNGSGQFVRNDGNKPPVQLPIEPMTAAQFDVSPDGRRIAVVKLTADASELWVHDMVTGEGFQWARATVLVDPRWSPDSRRVAVVTAEPPDRAATVIITQGRVDSPDTLRGAILMPSHWFSERRMLASTNPNLNPQLVWLELNGDGTVRADTVRSTRSQQRGVVSPDGKLVAYASADEIVVDMIGGGGRSTIGRGIDPLWLDARTLAVRGGGGIWFRVRVNADASPASRPQQWFSDPRFVDTNLRSNAVTPNGEMVYVQGPGRTTSSFLRVVPRWTDEVRAKVAAEER